MGGASDLKRELQKASVAQELTEAVAQLMVADPDPLFRLPPQVSEPATEREARGCTLVISGTAYCSEGGKIWSLSRLMSPQLCARLGPLLWASRATRGDTRGLEWVSVCLPDLRQGDRKHPQAPGGSGK